MKTQKNILLAFILNLCFSVFEFIGGILTGSVAIMSDALHDTGDALSIGVSYFLEKKSLKHPDQKYTYGYRRYSVLGGLITTVILLTGSVLVITNSIKKIINPSEINAGGMIIFAVLGVIINLAAALFTRKGDSINQKAVNLHMLEDVLGWIVVLAGSIIIRFTGFTLIDPIMSIGVAVFILINAFRNLKDITDIFLEKTPENIDIAEITEHIEAIEGIKGVHHIHVRTIDGSTNFATMHIVTNENSKEIKDKVRKELKEHGIVHATLELETENEICTNHHCHIEFKDQGHHHHHHH
ncbi:MAG: cation transporter [Clostridia bacterium]|nr:cation transporter [Clostridia bacterium]